MSQSNFDSACKGFADWRSNKVSTGELQNRLKSLEPAELDLLASRLRAERRLLDQIIAQGNTAAAPVKAAR